jgi:hypothetical protein
VIRRCPSIEKLEAFAAGRAPRVEKHVLKCTACQGVLALMVGQAGDGVEEESCAQVELLLAARELGPLSDADATALRRHAASCEACASLVEAPRGE